MFTIKYLYINWFVEIWITFSEHSINLQHNDINLLLMKSIPEPLQSTYHLCFGFLFLFHVNDLFCFLPRCNKCKHYKAIEQALKSKICACRLDRESHKISCTDFPNWQDCLSNCNFMPTRFQTRSLGDCHQNLWSSEHWLWI